MMKKTPCHLDPDTYTVDPRQARQKGIGPEPPSYSNTRRNFLARLGAGFAGLSCMDFLGYFNAYGAPQESKLDSLASDASSAADDPHFLIYWYIEGGWSGYDMFNPVASPNHVMDRLDNISDERYRILEWGDDYHRIYNKGGLRYGYLAEPGEDLFTDMAIISSMHTGSGHSRDRLNVHMGDYKFRQTDERQPDERSVMQAFAEAYGQPYAAPNLSWHWWLSDGELNEAQYTGKRGYYHALGPTHAHTIYAGTPSKLRNLLMRAQMEAADVTSRQIESFLDGAHREFLKDDNIQAVQGYHSALEIYRSMSQRGAQLDPTRLKKLFTDPELRRRFGIEPEDELITYRSVNGNKARSKFAPATKVQAMMAFEMIREGLSCASFIESRDVRRFDSHYSRSNLWKSDGTPVGMPNQETMMKEDLWDPLHVMVDLLKKTEYKNSGRSYFDHTNIVLTSEFGRTMHGNVDGILKKDISDDKKDKEIGGQDISAHWQVTSSAFLGGSVRGNTQFGKIGRETLKAIPILPDGNLDPNFDPETGNLLPDREKSPESFIPNHGDIYATALALSGLNPKGRGRNERPEMKFVFNSQKG